MEWKMVQLFSLGCALQAVGNLRGSPCEEQGGLTAVPPQGGSSELTKGSSVKTYVMKGGKSWERGKNKAEEYQALHDRAGNTPQKCLWPVDNPCQSRSCNPWRILLEDKKKHKEGAAEEKSEKQWMAERNYYAQTRSSCIASWKGVSATCSNNKGSGDERGKRRGVWSEGVTGKAKEKPFSKYWNVCLLCFTVPG